MELMTATAQKVGETDRTWSVQRSDDVNGGCGQGIYKGLLARVRKGRQSVSQSVSQQGLVEGPNKRLQGAALPKQDSGKGGNTNSETDKHRLGGG